MSGKSKSPSSGKKLYFRQVKTSFDAAKRPTQTAVDNEIPDRQSLVASAISDIADQAAQPNAPMSRIIPLVLKTDCCGIDRPIGVIRVTVECEPGDRDLLAGLLSELT
jgi:hypothetical protein